MPSMENEVELKPCPFCGADPAWGEGEQKTKYGNEQVYCSSCYAITPPGATKAEASEWWNTRATARLTPAEAKDKVREVVLGWYDSCPIKLESGETINRHLAMRWPDEAEVLIDRIATELVATGETEWQPIESAPKDGTGILTLRWLDGAGWWYQHVQWLNDDWMVCNDGDSSVANPTLWQPLPSPPLPRESKEEVK